MINYLIELVPVLIAHSFERASIFYSYIRIVLPAEEAKEFGSHNIDLINVDQTSAQAERERETDVCIHMR